jgi:retron-type reverse transcriptase
VPVLQRRALQPGQSVRRVYVLKANGKRRPLSIPALMDRCHQARVGQALEPEWEARFEPRSYGFRPGRGCADAIAALFTTLKGNSKRTWIVDADLSAAFDRIDHSRLLTALGSLPARDMIQGFDFLGFSVRRYRNGKLLIKPSSAAVERLRRRLRRPNRGTRQRFRQCSDARHDVESE